MKKTLLASAILSAFALAGCGGGKSSNSSDGSATGTPPPVPPVPPVSVTSVAGVVNKGIVKNAVIEVCVVNQSNANDKSCGDQVLATEKTDSNGKYSIATANLPKDQPLLFVLKPQKDAQGKIITQMKCDYKACITEQTKFGDDFVVAEDFKLISILAVGQESLTANMTSLTDAVAEHAIRASRGSIDNDLLNISRSVIAQLFGIEPQKLLTLGAIDLTDAKAVEAAQKNGDTDSIIVAALSAAFADTKPDLETLFDLADKLINSQNDAKTAELELQRKALLSSASNIIETVVAENAKTQNVNVNLTAITDKIKEIEKELPKIELPEATGDIAKAQELIKQIRTVYSAASKDGALITGLQNWGDALQAIPTELFEEDFTQALEMLQAGLLSIAHRVDERLKDYPGDFDADITAEGKVFTLIIEGDTTKPSLHLVVEANIDWNDSFNDADNTEVVDAPIIELKIKTLIAKSGKVILDAESGLAQIIGLKGDRERNGNWSSENEETYSLLADKLTLEFKQLKITAEDETKQPVSFVSDFAFNIEKAKISGFEYSQSVWEDNNTTYNDFETQTISAAKVHLSVSGQLNYQEQSSKLGFAINLDNPDSSLVYLSCMRYAWSWVDGVYKWDNEDSRGLYLASSSCNKTDEWTLIEETADNFLRGSVTLSLETKINQQNPQVAAVSIQAARSALDALHLSADVRYNEQRLGLKTQLKTETDKQPVTVELANNDAIAVLKEGSKQGEITGHIKVNNKIVANIEFANGVAVVRYINGKFETLF